MAEPVVLYCFALSPYSNKAEVMLRFKRLPVRRVFVNPIGKREIAFSQKKLVPIIDDGGTIVEDSTEIAHYLERRYPEPPMMPAEPAARDRALEIEDWVDAELAPRFAARTFGADDNMTRALRITAESTPGMPALLRAAMPLLGRFTMKRRWKESRALGPERRLDQALDRVEQHLAGSRFLAGDRLSVADLAAYGVLSPLERYGLAGWEQVTGRARLAAWVRALEAALPVGE